DHLYNYVDGAYRRTGETIARQLADKMLGQWSKPEHIESAIRLMKHRAAREEAELDCYDEYDESLVNVKNGMLGLKTFQLYDHDPAFLSTIQLPVIYDPKARSSVVEAFIRQVMIPDAIDVFWEFVGSVLIGSTKHEKSAFLIGPRGS